MVFTMGQELARASVAYKKKTGIMILTKDKLIWTASDPAHASRLTLINSRILSMFASKAGAAKVALRIHVATDDTRGSPEEQHTFFFIATTTAQSDRETLKRELGAVILSNRQNVNSAAYLPGTHSTANDGETTGLQEGPSGSAEDSEQMSTFEIRKRVLVSDPNLAMIHRELVISGQITENEFWGGREHLLQLEVATASQKPGRSGQIINPKPSVDADGQVKVQLTQRLIREIFEEFPVVQDIYTKHVGFDVCLLSSPSTIY